MHFVRGRELHRHGPVDCLANARALVLAMRAYHDDFGCFPPASLPGKDGRPAHSWRVLILPYLDSHPVHDPERLQRLYDSYDFDEPWDGPNNRKLADELVEVFVCPFVKPSQPLRTSYVVVTGKGTAFEDGKHISLAAITDDHDATILVVEIRDSDIAWTEPRDLEIAKMRLAGQGTSANTIGSLHDGASAALVDGSARGAFLAANVKNLKSWFTIGGGEAVGRGDF